MELGPKEMEHLGRWMGVILSSLIRIRTGVMSGAIGRSIGNVVGTKGNSSSSESWWKKLSSSFAGSGPPPLLSAAKSSSSDSTKLSPDSLPVSRTWCWNPSPSSRSSPLCPESTDRPAGEESRDGRGRLNILLPATSCCCPFRWLDFGWAPPTSCSRSLFLFLPLRLPKRTERTLLLPPFLSFSGGWDGLSSADNSPLLVAAATPLDFRSAACSVAVSSATWLGRKVPPSDVRLLGNGEDGDGDADSTRLLRAGEASGELWAEESPDWGWKLCGGLGQATGLGMWRPGRAGTGLLEANAVGVLLMATTCPLLCCDGGLVASSEDDEFFSIGDNSNVLRWWTGHSAANWETGWSGQLVGNSISSSSSSSSSSFSS